MSGWIDTLLLMKVTSTLLLLADLNTKKEPESGYEERMGSIIFLDN